MESRISGHTGLLALIGSPVGHSGSPAMHNYSFARLGMDYLGEIDESEFESVVDYYKDLKISKTLPKSKVASLLKQYRDNPTNEIRTEIINSQLKEVLLIACAYKLRHAELNLSDLVQTCNIGLMTAVDKYDSDTKLPFETYLNYWILNEIEQEFKQA